MHSPQCIAGFSSSGESVLYASKVHASAMQLHCSAIVLSLRFMQVLRFITQILQRDRIEKLCHNL